MTMANVDGSGRQIKIIWHDDGVMVEAGCFKGPAETFIARAQSEGKTRYASIMSAIITSTREQ